MPKSISHAINSTSRHEPTVTARAGTRHPPQSVALPVLVLPPPGVVLLGCALYCQTPATVDHTAGLLLGSDDFQGGIQPRDRTSLYWDIIISSHHRHERGRSTPNKQGKVPPN